MLTGCFLPHSFNLTEASPFNLPDNTMYDRQEADIEEAKKFLKKWQKEVAKRVSSEEKQLARISQELREQEFAEMREKQLVIHTGELSGKLLVDVLTEDLMEAA